MNLNDFVVLPNNKAKSVKLSARNLQELQMETVTLAQESKEMEEKLQQLKDSMSKEKKERGGNLPLIKNLYISMGRGPSCPGSTKDKHINTVFPVTLKYCNIYRSTSLKIRQGGFRWTSGQSGPLNSNALTNSTKKNKENRLQKMSAGKVKIRFLKDKPLPAPPLPLPPPPASPTSLRTARKNRLRGTICGQCEVKTAGLMCAECTENYCISCFAKFHHKGALKLHRMIPIQTDLHTHVSTLDVISSFQKQIDHSLYPSTFTNISPIPYLKSLPPCHQTGKCDQSPKKGTEDVAKPMPFHPEPNQVLVITKEEKFEMTEEVLGKKDEEEISMSLLSGEYSEEESARSFQEALRQWKGEKGDTTGEPTSESAMWIPVRPVSVSAIATQVELPPVRGTEGRVSERGKGKKPIMVEFTENSLTYMDRLLLKKHRRTPVELYRTSLGFAKGLKLSSDIVTKEESANSLTDQEEDFHHYCASLFAVSANNGMTEPQITTPESCLVIDVLDETDRDGVFVGVKMSDNRFPSVQWDSSNRRTLIPQTNLTNDSGREIFWDSLGLDPDEQAQRHKYATRGRSRREEQGNPATSHLGDSFVSADAEREEVFLSDEPEQLSEPSMVLHSQSAGSGSELLCDLHEFTPLGLDMNSGHSDTPEHTYSDPLHTCQTLLKDPNQTGSEDHGAGSSYSTYKLVPALCSLSRATQEIMDICYLDQTGCEDPDLDTDATAHTLHSLEQELRLFARETGAQASAFGMRTSVRRDRRENLHLTRGRVSEKQKEEEEAAQKDLQSVLLLS